MGPKPQMGRCECTSASHLQSAWFILLRSLYLKYIDLDGSDHGTMDCNQLITATKEDIEMYNAMMESPLGFETAYPDVTSDEMLCLHKSFVLCELTPQLLRHYCVWKCGCAFTDVTDGLHQLYRPIHEVPFQPESEARQRPAS